MRSLTMIQEATEKLIQHKDLSRQEMESAMEEIMKGEVDTVLIVSFLNALSAQGETIEELTAAVSVMRRHSVRVKAKEEIILDTCGTGGDKLGTFNVSTAVAFVASGIGITVAKHGNRSVSSKCGSADILEALGININMDKKRIEHCLSKAGIAFLFAPNLHPAMKYAMPARKQIGKRTIFNILGPLTNPALATHQLIGVFDPGLTEVIARVLLNLKTAHAVVVHGRDGLDEVTLTDKTLVCDASPGKISNYEISPEDFGLKRARLEDLKGGGAKDNAEILLQVLSGKPGPYRDVVLLNSACAIYAADKADSIKKGLVLARQSLDSGQAKEKLELLKICSNEES